MRYAIYPHGEMEISHFLIVPENLIEVVTPSGFSFIPVGEDVQQETHIILNGEAVIKEKE